MLQFARTLRQQRQLQNEDPDKKSSGRSNDRDQKSITGYTPPPASKSALICSICCGSLILCIGVGLLVTGLQYEETACIVTGAICPVFGVLILCIAVNIIVREATVSTASKASNVAVARKEIRFEESDSAEADNRKELVQRPYVVVQPPSP